MFVVPILLAAIFLCVLTVPWLVTIICGFVVILQLSCGVIRCWTARYDMRSPIRCTTGPSPVFSVHVATHNEPPALVIATLAALAVQDWPASEYEVIVVDNNTCDPALWVPVRKWCDKAGAPFRFLHRDGVKGAKAGALNIALAEARPDMTHVVTVDADYRVDPQFLSQAAAALRMTGADYVQFPQAYVGCDRIAAGVDAELAEYFSTNAQMADVAEAVLLTGTLCVISAPALFAANGWSSRTITEDADLGVRLCRMGFSGRFIGKIVGRGLLPLSFRDLERQRHRWASGNLQTLIAHGPAILLGRDGLGWRRRGAIISQLTAWLNLSLLPAAALLFGLATGQGGDTMLTVAGASVCLTFTDIVGRLLGQRRHDPVAPVVAGATICHRLALAPVAACATMEVLAGRSLAFAVTDKSGLRGGGANRLPLASLLLFVIAALVLPAAHAHGWLVIAAVMALLAPFPAALATSRTLDRYRQALTASPQGVPA